MELRFSNIAAVLGATLLMINAFAQEGKIQVKQERLRSPDGRQEIKNYNDLIAEIRRRQAKDEMPVEVKRGDVSGR